MSIRLLALIALFGLIALAAPVRAQPVPAAGFDVTVFQGGLSAPIAVAFLPDGRMLIAEKGGALKLRDTGGSVSTLITIGVCTDSEMGLLGVAVDPNFGSNGFIYLYRTDNSAGCASATGRLNQVVRVTMGAGDTVNPSSLAVLLSGIRTDDGNHDGGVLRIGPDNKLYVGVGDTGNGDNQGGPGSSTNPYSQDLNSLNGKVLRLNLDGTSPSDNPFFNQVGKRGEIFAYGFRNPFRFSFDPGNGNAVGRRRRRPDGRGDRHRHVWRELRMAALRGDTALRMRAARVTSIRSSPTRTAAEPRSGPASSAAHSRVPGSAAFDNDYFFGDCTSHKLFHAVPNGSRDDIATPSLFVDAADTPSDIVFGPDGALYYAAVGRRAWSAVSHPSRRVATSRWAARSSR